MLHFQYIFIAFCVLLAKSDSYWYKCTENENCFCQADTILNSLDIHCENVTTFPNFTNFSSPFDTLYLVKVEGDYSEIPPNALVPLGNLNGTNLEFTRENYSNIPLTIHDTSFDTVSDGFLSIEFYNVNLPVASVQALTDLPIQTLIIEHANLITLQENTFSGLKIVNLLNLLQNNISFIQARAFSGLSGSPDLYLWFNSLTVLNDSNIFTQFSSLYLDNNNISYIGPYAFSCDNTSGCSNVNVKTVSLSNNQIAYIDDNAFGNLPNLSTLTLVNANLQNIPTKPLQRIAATANYLLLAQNNITTVPPNAFYGFRIYVLLLDFNPIVRIDPGAFNGVWMYEGNLALRYLNELRRVDVLITYGMVNVVALRFSSCQNLTDIDLEEPGKLPTSLSALIFNHENNIQNVSPNFAAWLDVSFDKLMDLSNNANFNCTPNIAWMAKYAVCDPVQIYTDSTYCAQDPQLPLLDYLKSTRPVC